MTASDLTLAQRHYLFLSALRWFPVGLVIPVMVLLFRARGLDLAEISSSSPATASRQQCASCRLVALPTCSAAVRC